jgi:TPR repeat protein
MIRAGFADTGGAMRFKKWLLVFICCAGLLALADVAVAEQFFSAEIRELMTRASAGDAEAQFQVGVAFDSGEGAPRDAALAMKWYRAAAGQGYVEAENSLGSALQAQKRYDEARPWYEKASARGHAPATNNLAYLYDFGLGVAQDKPRALDLYTRAADLGWAEAMWNIANMYGAGQLGEKDLVRACIWSKRAKKFASPAEGRLLELLGQAIPYLENTLSREQLASCNRQWEGWVPIALRPVKPGSPARQARGMQ